MSHQYRPSLSTGIFGVYVVNNLNPDDYDEKEEKQSTSFKQKSVESFFADNYDKDIPIEDIYETTKQIDAKYQLIFKPECNYKGCCNKPEIDCNLIKGDMYICKEHRMTMAAKLKKELGSNRCLDPIILKLEQYNDTQLYKEGKQMESNDYFLQSYSKMQQQKLQISKQLLTLNPSSFDYWDLIIKYKKLQQYTSLLLKVRKISNPFLAVLVIVVIAVCVICLIVVCCCSDSSSKSKSSKKAEAKKQREEARKKREKAIKDAENALSALDVQFFKNENLKKECQLIFDGKIQKVQNYEQELNNIQGKMDTATTNIKTIDDNIKRMEKRLKTEISTLPISEILALQTNIEQNKTDKIEEEKKQRKHEIELQEKREAEAYNNMKREAEIARYKLQLKEEEEDRLNFDRAKTRAEILCRNTSNGRVSVYVVYDSRCSFYRGACSAYDANYDECYTSYGNWKIYKFEANSIQKHYTTSYNKFEYVTTGKSTFWVHYNYGYDKNYSGDRTSIEIR